MHIRFVKRSVPVKDGVGKRSAFGIKGGIQRKNWTAWRSTKKTTIKVPTTYGVFRFQRYQLGYLILISR